jgi:hypothetical protein
MYKSILLMLLSLLVIAPSVRSERKVVAEPPPKISMRIIFVSFGAETLVPITMSSIDQNKYLKVWFVRSLMRDNDHPFVSKLGKMLQANTTKEEIDDNLVRLKVEIGGDTFYADRNGTVLKKNTCEKFQLSKEQMQEIESSMANFDGVVDIWASQRISSLTSRNK